MTKNHYLVETKCGHVGSFAYIPITFALIAESGRDAARLARDIPRVKHNNKFAIISVRKVTQAEYEQQIEINKNDTYLNWKKQRFDEDYDCDQVYDRIVYMTDNIVSTRKEKKPAKRIEPRQDTNIRKMIWDSLQEINLKGILLIST
jgi:hypothetical protein